MRSHRSIIVRVLPVAALALSGRVAAGAPGGVSGQLSVVHVDEDAAQALPPPHEGGLWYTERRETELHFAAEGWRQLQPWLLLDAKALILLAAVNHSSGYTDYPANDAGTQLGFHFALPRSFALSALIYPFDAEPLRLGWLYSLSIRRYLPGRSNFVGAPGFIVRLSRGPWSAFWGFKLHGLPAAEGGTEAALSTVGGAAVELAKGLVRLELEGGYFDRGALSPENFLDPHTFSAGGAARAVVKRRLAADDLLDTMVLPRFDPNRDLALLRPLTPPARELGWMVALEGIGEAARVGDVTGWAWPPLGSATEAGFGVGARGRLAWRGLDLELSALYRNRRLLEDTLDIRDDFNRAPDAEVGDLLLVLAGQLRWARLALAVGGTFFLELPADETSSMKGSVGNEPPVTIDTLHILLRSTGRSTTLRDGRTPRPILGGKVQLRWDPLRYLTLLAWFEVRRDPDLDVPGLAAGRTIHLLSPVGFGVAAAARY